MPEHVPSTTATTHELPDPSLPSATGRPTARAYATVLILYALAGGPHLAGAALSLLHLYGVNLPVSSLQVESGGRLIGIALAAAWLLRLTASGPRPADASRRWGRVIAFVGALTLIAADQVGEFASDHSSVRGVGRLAELILWVWLCRTLTARSGFTLPRPHLTGLLSPKRKQPSTQRQAQAQARWELVLYAHAAALLTAVLLVDALKELPGPVLTGDQAAAAGVPDLGSHLAHGIWSATIEELLATAVVVTLLTTVGRPLWEVLTVTALMRTLPHAYLGLLPMLAMLVPALAAGWLYHRYRRVLPLILAHALYNTASTLHLLPPPALMLLLALAAAAWAWHETRSTSPTEHGTFQRPQGVTRPHPTTPSHSSDTQEGTGSS